MPVGLPDCAEAILLGRLVRHSLALHWRIRHAFRAGSSPYSIAYLSSIPTVVPVALGLSLPNWIFMPTIGTWSATLWMTE
jgi:hypothetical protein